MIGNPTLPQFLKDNEDEIMSIDFHRNGIIANPTLPEFLKQYASDYALEMPTPSQTDNACICGSIASNPTLVEFLLEQRRKGFGLTERGWFKLRSGGRRFLGIEMGDHFYDVILPRMKKVFFDHKTGKGHWNGGKHQTMKPYTGKAAGGCLKYYDMEQYEDTLRRAKYQDSEHFPMHRNRKPAQQYPFFGDEKLAYAICIDKDNKIQIDLTKLYPDIGPCEIAETISNLLGKTIRRITEDEVTFSDETKEKINPKKMTEEEKMHFIRILKPALWWGEDLPWDLREIADRITVGQTLKVLEKNDEGCG